MSKELIWGQNLEIDFWIDFSEWFFNPTRGFSSKTGYISELSLPSEVFDYFHIKLNDIDYYKKPEDWKPSDDDNYTTDLEINTPFGKLMLKSKDGEENDYEIKD